MNRKSVRQLISMLGVVIIGMSLNCGCIQHNANTQNENENSRVQDRGQMDADVSSVSSMPFIIQTMTNSDPYNYATEEERRTWAVLQYPQFQDIPNENIINGIIKDYAFEMLKNENGSSEINVSFEMKTCNSSIISICFLGSIDNAVSHSNITKTLNIDMHTAQEIKLDQFFQITNAFACELYQEKYIVVPKAVSGKEVMELLGSQREFAKTVLSSEVEANIFFYFTKTHLGFYIEAPQILGSWIAFEVPYDGLEEFSK